VGDWVLAIGNPYGFDRTVSFGIVSGKGRFIPGVDSEVPLLNDFIQTDALIDPGNSGGPLVNLNGDVIGINSVGIGRGQGFTIPANVVRDVITRAEVEGRIQRGWLGIYLQPFTPEMADYLGHPRLRGVLVSDLVQGGPADQAGLKSGDVLTRFDQVELDADSDDSINRFIQMVSSLEPKARISVGIHRQGQSLERVLTVGIQPPVDAAEVDTDFGFGAKQITQALFLEYRLDQREGVLVSYVTRGSAAQEANLEVGDVIVKIDDNPIRTVEDFRKQLSGLERRARFLITLKRGTVTRYALIDLSRYRAPKPAS
jgi:S1-C subfamily serine protease